ncbi:hypothetical protein ACOMHN_043395 [Nucella lapillus]
MGTKYGELVALNEETEQVAWRTEKLATEVFVIFKGLIFSVTCTGNIELYTPGGERKVTGGLLRDVWEVHVHPTAPFLLVSLHNDLLFLVNDQMKVFPLHLPSPQVPRDPDSLVFVDVFFGIEDDHSDGELDVAVQRDRSLCVVTFTTRGDIVGHLFLNGGPSFPMKVEQSGRKCVFLRDGHVMAHSIQCGSGGIVAELLWKRPLPARFSYGLPGQLMKAGRKFLLCSNFTWAGVYRMDHGTLAAEFPFSFTDDRETSYHLMAGPRGSVDEVTSRVDHIETGLLRFYRADTRPDMLYIIGTDWLDGLSPSTVRHDFPVAVITSKENPKGRCLRWSEGVGKLLLST